MMNSERNVNFSQIFLIIFFISLTIVSPQNIVNFVTYGANSNPKEGDNDFIQVFFIEIDNPSIDSISVEIFDADCFGNHDQQFGKKFNSEFKYSLYGGSKCYSAESIKTDSPTSTDLYKGSLIKSLYVSNQEEYNNKWKKFANVAKTDGELIDGKYYLKIIVEGISGNDANVYNIRATSKDNKKVRIFNYAPTVHLLSKMSPIQLRFNTADNSKLKITNYDADNANLIWKSPYSEGQHLTSSGDGEWKSNKIKIESYEMNEICAIQFGPGGKKNNDAVFFIQNENMEFIPIELPIKTIVKNVRPNLEANVKFTSECYGVILDASNSSDNSGDPISAKWVLPDGEILKELTPKVSFEKAGDYKVILAIKDKSNSIESGKYKILNVKVNEPPVAIAGKDILKSPNQIINFNASLSHDSDGKIIKYLWDLGNGNSVEGKRYSFKYEKPGTYNVILTVEDDGLGNCTKDHDTIKVIINAQPIANAGKDIACSLNENINISGASSYDSDGEIISYTWNFGDGTNGNGPVISHSYSQPGIYKVYLNVVDNSGTKNGRATDNLIVNVNSKPIAKAGEDIEISVDEMFTLDAGKSYDKDGQIIEYLWKCENEFEIKGKRIEHSFKEPGKYKIKLSVKDNSQTSSNIATDFKYVVVNSQPVAKAGDEVYQTNPEVHFDASQSFDRDGNIIKYSWDFGDGNKSNSKEVAYLYRAPGVYKVTLTVKDNSPALNNKAVTSKIVTINSKPIADAGPDLTVAPNEEFLLTSKNSLDIDGMIKSTVWSTENNIISDKSSFTYKFSEPGKKEIQLMVLDNSNQNEAIDYDNVIVHVNESPTIIVQNKYLIAIGDTLTLDASKSFDKDGEIIEYKWFSDGEVISQKPIIKRNYKSGGKHKIVLSVMDNSKVSNSISKKEIEIFVNNPPSNVEIQDIKTCSNLVKLSANGSFDKDSDKLGYTWILGDGMTMNGKNIEHRYLNSGVFPVTLIVDDGNNVSNSIVKTEFKIKINTPPIANAGEDETVCSGDIITMDASKSFDADGDLLKYVWDFGDSTYGSGLTVNKNYGIPGLYKVNLKVTDNSGLECKSSIDTKIIRVIESPVAFAGEDITTCSNVPVIFNAFKSTDSDGIVNSFEWDFGDGEKGGGEKTSHIYKKAGVYNVILTITGELTGDCDNVDSDELIVVVQDAPFAEYTYSDSVALKEEVIFDASSSDGKGSEIGEYLWTFGDGNTGEGKQIKHRYSKSGNYIVGLTITTKSTSECNISSTKKTVYVNDAPIAKAGKDLSVDVNELFLLDASDSFDPNGEIVKFVWEFEDGVTKEGVNVYHSFAKSGTYSIKLKVYDETKLSNNYGVDELKIKVNEPPTGVIEAPNYSFIGISTSINLEGINDPDGNVSKYMWTFDNLIDSTSKSLKHVFERKGNYDLTCKLTDNGNSTSVINKHIMIYELPKLEIKNLTTCLNWKSTLAADYNFTNSKIDFPVEWIFHDGKKFSGKTIDVTFVKPGKQTITVNLMNPINSKEVLINSSFDVFVNQSPTAKIMCENESYIGGANDFLQLDASKSFDPDGDILTYEWDFGDGNKSFGKNVFHKYQSAGEYKVELIVNDNRGTNCSRSAISKIVKIIYR